MRSFLATPLLILALSLAALPAAAQTPASPSMTVTVSGLPTEITGFSSNNTTSVPFQVQVAVRNIVCPAASSVAVTLSVEAMGAPAFMAFAVEPATVDIPVAQGAHTTTAAGGSAEAAVVVTVREILANATVPVTVKASAAPPSCQSAGGLSAQEGSASANATVTAPPPPPPPPPVENDSPGPGAVLGVVAALVAASFRRRRSA